MFCIYYAGAYKNTNHIRSVTDLINNNVQIGLRILHFVN